MLAPMQQAEPAPLRVVDHPLAAAQLTLLRARGTAPNEFRPALRKLAVFLLVEAARDWETRAEEMQSPLSTLR